MSAGTAEEQGKKWECSEWDVRHDRRPDKPPILTVTGECVFPTTFRVVLEKHEPQDDPEVLKLDLVANVPHGASGKVEHSEPFVKLFQEKKAPIYLNFRMETEHEYKTVTILDAESGEVVKEGIRVKPVLPH